MHHSLCGPSWNIHPSTICPGDPIVHYTKKDGVYTDKNIETVLQELISNSHSLSSKMINTTGKINAYLTHVSHPTIKNLVKKMDENNHALEQVALSLQNMKNYIWDNIAPLQKVLTAFRQTKTI